MIQFFEFFFMPLTIAWVPLYLPPLQWVMYHSLGITVLSKNFTLDSSLFTWADVYQLRGR